MFAWFPWNPMGTSSQKRQSVRHTRQCTTLVSFFCFDQIIFTTSRRYRRPGTTWIPGRPTRSSGRRPCARRSSSRSRCQPVRTPACCFLRRSLVYLRICLELTETALHIVDRYKMRAQVIWLGPPSSGPIVCFVWEDGMKGKMGQKQRSWLQWYPRNLNNLRSVSKSRRNSNKTPKKFFSSTMQTGLHILKKLSTSQEAKQIRIKPGPVSGLYLQFWPSGFAGIWSSCERISRHDWWSWTGICSNCLHKVSLSCPHRTFYLLKRKNLKSTQAECKSRWVHYVGYSCLISGA